MTKEAAGIKGKQEFPFAAARIRPHVRVDTIATMVFGSNIGSATIAPYDDIPASSPSLETNTLEDKTGSDPGKVDEPSVLPVDDSHTIVENNNTTTTITSSTDIFSSFSVKLRLSAIRSNGDFLVKQDEALRITLTVQFDFEEAKNKDIFKMKLSNAKVGMIADCKFGKISKY